MNMTRRKRLWLIGGTLLALAATGTFLARTQHRSQAAVAAAGETARTRATSKDMVALVRGVSSRSQIRTVKAGRAELAADLEVVGAVSRAEDHFAVVGPSVNGRIVRIYSGVGDSVKKGQVIAEIESVDAGQARADYIAAKAASAAAEANYAREKELADHHISSSREREVAETQAVSQRAKMRAAVERLRAIGLDHREIRALEKEGGTSGRVPLRAPIAGTVLQRTVTLGEAVERSTDAFTIADLAHLWVMLDIYEKDLARVHEGEAVNVRTETYPGEVFKGRVAYVEPVIDEKTRTAKVRIELDNRHRKLRVNQFVTARIIGDRQTVASGPMLSVPLTALQRVEGTPVVFVRKGEGFEKRVIEPGISGGDLVEVRSGLREGEEVAMVGAFLLKSELLR
jgi:cobalt-zinc-cadmium efflux system membrane fusion protein